MSKVLKSVELDGVTKDAELDSKEGKRTILKVIDKSENKEDRMKTGDDIKVFPETSDPVLNEASNTILDQNAKDYSIQDLTKEDLADEDEVKDVIDKVDIFKVLNSVDTDMIESHGEYGDLNILFSRSSKDSIRESALVEYTTASKKSYVLGLNILESDNGNVKFVVKSSYGKDIYSKDCKPSSIVNDVYRFMEAVYLRDKFANVLTESVDSDRWGEILSDINNHAKELGSDKDAVTYSYSEDDSRPLEVTVSKGTDEKVFKGVYNYVMNTYKDELDITDVDGSSFLMK